jgi:hypothetical protein
MADPAKRLVAFAGADSRGHERVEQSTRRTTRHVANDGASRSIAICSRVASRARAAAIRVDTATDASATIYDGGAATAHAGHIHAGFAAAEGDTAAVATADGIAGAVAAVAASIGVAVIARGRGAVATHRAGVSIGAAARRGHASGAASGAARA